MRQHDRADHGDQQDQAGDLKQEGVIGVENGADRAGIGEVGGDWVAGEGEVFRRDAIEISEQIW